MTEIDRRPLPAGHNAKHMWENPRTNSWNKLTYLTSHHSARDEKQGPSRNFPSGGTPQTQNPDLDIQKDTAPDAAGFVDVCACLYHRQVFEDLLSGGAQERGLKPMDRYLAEGPHQQYAFFRRPDNSNASTNKGCTCKLNPTEQNSVLRGLGSGEGLADKGYLSKW